MTFSHEIKALIPGNGPICYIAIKSYISVDSKSEIVFLMSKNDDFTGKYVCPYLVLFFLIRPMSLK